MLIAFLCRATAFAQALTPVPQLDATHFTGSWYELARSHDSREKHCASDVVQLISLGDKPRQLQLVVSCIVAASGKIPQPYIDSWNYTAKVDKAGNTFSGRLKVSTLPLLSRPYWVLAVGPETVAPVIASPKSDRPAAPPATVSADPAPVVTSAPPATIEKPSYSWLLIGTPNHKSLWAFSRTRTLPAASMDDIKARAAAMGFDPGQLVITPQSQGSTSLPGATASAP